VAEEIYSKVSFAVRARLMICGVRSDEREGVGHRDARAIDGSKTRAK